MSKAVEKAYEAYPLNESNRYNHEWNAKRVGFQQGYEQAEKDLELTWKDVRDICDLAYNLRFSHKKQKEFFEEVLKRYKEQRT